jgi:hypothetical protein
MKPTLLVLENFQSIRERTEIPIAPITFLYGPNSAGKSCIDDAFSLISSVFEKKQSPDLMIERWSRIESNATGTIQHKGQAMKVELHCQTGRIFSGLSEVAGFGDLVGIKGGLVNWFEENEWRVVLGLESNEYEISVIFRSGSETVFKIRVRDDGDELEVSLKAFGRTYEGLTGKHLISSKRRKKTLKFACEMSWHDGRVSVFKGNDLERDIVAIVNAMLADLTNLKISPKNLGPDRSTIKNQSLSWICGGEYVFGSHWQKTDLPRAFYKGPVFEMPKNKDLNFSFMKDLAESFFLEGHRKRNQLTGAEAIPEEREFRELIETVFMWDKDIQQDEINEPLHTFVNRCLREHLFLDQGYQITFDILEIQPAESVGNPPLSAALMIGSLLDATGRRMTFEDVGTGISCVIPVLVSVHSGSSFIQQPELHLHPALQSALGDILIEGTKSSNVFHFIETHSEYLLLRCLRRVRETSANRHSRENPLFVRPEDFSVLYFEPQPEGFTTVKRIRVSTQGDFIDRWPRGFFEERGKELFDE